MWQGCIVQVQLMCRYLNPNGEFIGIMEVPDPYYGGAKGFELVSCEFMGIPFIHPHPAGHGVSVAFALNRATIASQHQPAADVSLCSRV